MKQIRVRNINIGSYREHINTEHINTKFGSDIELISEHTHITLANIEEFIANGDSVVISIFDLYNEISYIDRSIRNIKLQDNYKMEALTASDIGSPIIPSEVLSKLITAFKYISNLYLACRDMDNVLLLYNTYEYDGDINCEVVEDNYDGCGEYGNTSWFLNIFKSDDILTTLHTSIFGPPPWSSNPLKGIVARPASLSGLDVIDNSLPRILICVQDKEESIVQYINDIIDIYPPNTCIYVYDIGSTDNTYNALNVYIENTNIYVCNIKRMNITDASKKLGKILMCNISNIYIHTYNTELIKYQEIESFATVITDKYKYEGDVLLHSLREYHDQPVHINCDEETKAFLIGNGHSNIKYYIIQDTDKFDGIVPSGKFHSIRYIGEKMEAMRNALAHHNNTMFLDADIILLKEIIINSTSELILSPHQHKDNEFSVERYSGSFNAGYIFTNNSTFPDVWEDIYLHNSSFYEQEGMYNLISDFDIDIFNDTHNIGMWRGVVPEASQDTVSMHLHVDYNIDLLTTKRALVNTSYFAMLCRVLQDNGRDNILKIINNIPRIEYDDTTIIMCNWGYSDYKHNNICKILTEHSKQKGINFDIVLVELIFEGESSILGDFDFNGTHVILNGTDANRGIFQKENLWNIGLLHTNSEYLIFIDSDIWSKDEYWFNSVRRGIINDRTVVQGFSWVHDSVESDWIQQGVIAYYLFHYSDNKLRMNPGMIYGMSRKYIDSIYGFNTSSIVTDGDTIFIHEVFANDPPNYYRLELPQSCQSGYRELSKAEPNAVDVAIIHEHHGYRRDRPYDAQHRVLDSIGNWEKLVSIAENGLSIWNGNNKLREYMPYISDALSDSELNDIINIIKEDLA